MRAPGPRLLRALGAGAVLLAGLSPAAPLAGRTGPSDPVDGAGITARLSRSTADAERAVRDGEWATAESGFRDALFEALLLRGTLDLVEQRWEEASSAFEAARRAVADPRRAEIARAVLAVRRGSAEDALPILRSLVARRPDDTRARRLLAQVLAFEDRLPEAIQELEESHQIVPEDGETTFALATAYLRRGDPDARERAEELFEELMATRPDPLAAATAVLIGRSYLDYRDHDAAGRWLERALTLDPTARRASYYRGKIVLSSLGYDGLEQAEEHFRRELAAHPDDPLSSLFLGIVLTEMRRCDEAMDHLDRATDSPLTALDAHRFRGKCLLTAVDGDRDANARAARDALERALAIARESGRTRQLESVHYQLGVALRRLGDPAAAAEHFEAAEGLSSDLVADERSKLATFFSQGVETDPLAELLPFALQGMEALSALEPERRRELRRHLDRAAARAYTNLGTLAFRDDRPAAAARLFTAAAGHDPTLPGLDRNLGLAAFRAGQYERAADALSRVLESDPDAAGAAELRRALALSLVNLERYGAAADLLTRDPGRSSEPSLQYAYALALVRSGREDEAEAAFERLFREHPEWPELHVLLGQARARQGDFPGAVEALERAIELRPDVPEAHSTLGEIHLRRGELDAAIEAFETELTHHPGAIPARHQLAVALDLADRPEEAEHQLGIVLRRRPDFADARYLLGKVLLGQGRAEEAKSHLLAAAGEAPDDPNVHYQLALAHQRLGEADAAREELARYRKLKAEERGGDS